MSPFIIFVEFKAGFNFLGREFLGYNLVIKFIGVRFFFSSSQEL
jgi:hypothetical protein